MLKPLSVVHNLPDDARFTAESSCAEHCRTVPTHPKDENQEFARIVQELENQMSRLNQQEVSLQTHTDKFTSLKEGDIVPLHCHRKACISRCLVDWR